MAVKINGEPWVPDGGKGFQAVKPIRGGFFQIDTYPVYRVGIYIRTTSKDGQEMHLYLSESKVGEYRLNENTQIIPASLYPKNYAMYRAKGGQPEYVTSRENTGKVIITKADTVTGVVSGSFEFVAGSSKGAKVTIVEGRFDVNNRTQK